MVMDPHLDGRHNGPDGPKDGESAHALRIFIVEDDADTSDSMAILLDHWGFEAIPIRSAMEALQATRLLSPDLILLDIGMPGMDGLAFAKSLRGQVPPKGKMPFLIAISGYGDVQTQRRSKEAGIDLHLIKPVDPAELEAVLRRFQKVLMPSAERRVPESYRRCQLHSSLWHCSQRAMVQQCLVRAGEIAHLGTELSSRLRMVQNGQERAQIRVAWCEQTARFIDEAEKITHLLLTFQRWGTSFPTDA